MMCPPYFYVASPLLLVGHGAAATAMQKKACRPAAAYAAFASTATTAPAAASAAAAAAVQLLSCCCAAAVVTYGYLFSVFLKKYAVLRDASRSFLFSISTRCVFLSDLNAISAIRSSQTQSKLCRNEFGLLQVRMNYWLNDFYRKHYTRKAIRHLKPRQKTNLDCFASRYIVTVNGTSVYHSLFCSRRMYGKLAAVR